MTQRTLQAWTSSYLQTEITRCFIGGLLLQFGVYISVLLQALQTMNLQGATQAVLRNTQGYLESLLTAFCLQQNKGILKLTFSVHV